MLAAFVTVALHAIVLSLVAGAVLAGLVLAATRLLPLNAATRHALWTTTLVAMAVMPPGGIVAAGLKGAPAAAPAVRGAGASAVLERKAPGGLPGLPSLERPAASAPSPLLQAVPRVTRSLALALVAVWLAGAALGLGGLALSVMRVRGLRLRSSPLDATLAAELPWLTEIGPGREIYLRLSYETETPVAIGFRRPVILIPTELATAGGLGAIESLILHEHAHLRRYDDWTNLMQRTIERVFWFNPIVWLVGRRIALEREIASDDAVVERTGQAKEYATSLWRLAREMRMPAHAVVAPGALLTRKQISVRIEQLLDANRARLHPSPAAGLGIAAAALVAVALVATGAPALELPAASAPVTIFIKHVAEPPAPPALPAAAVQGIPPVPAGPGKRDHARHDGVRVTREMLAGCVGCSFRGADLSGLDLHGLNVTANDFTGANLRGADLSGAALTGDSLRDADLSGANLAHARVSAAELGGATLAHATLTGARFTGVSLKGVSLRGVAVRELVDRCMGCDLSGLDLRNADLHDIVLSGADLSGTDLRGANLSGARLQGVDLSGARLDGADLSNARLRGTDLRGGDPRT